MDADLLTHVAGRPEVKSVAVIGAASSANRVCRATDVFERAWSLANSRVEALGRPPLEACDVTAPRGRLVMVRIGDRVACALVAGHAQTSVLRYELREALRGAEAMHANNV